MDLWRKMCEGLLEFTACKLTGQHTDLNSQGLQSCHLRAAGSAKWTHIHKHIEESELKPQHEENKNSRDQRGQGAAWEREPE